LDSKVTSAAQKINPKIDPNVAKAEGKQHWVESVLHKCAVLEILKRLLDFILSVHDKRAISGDRLF
jgi:hypothetical protein